MPPLPHRKSAPRITSRTGTPLAYVGLTVAHPRRIVPGETYLITRRCYQRTFRLRPTKETNAIFAYCLALALAKTGVELHAVCVMSNHHHLVVTDPRGVLPEFLREFHRLTAKAMNALQGQWENLWAAEPCNVVRLVTDDDVAEKIAYVAANPVAAGVVANPREWPGLLLWEEAAVTARRPPAYFRETGTCAPELSLRVTPAPGQRRAPGRWERRVSAEVNAKVAEARRRLDLAGRTFLGGAVVMARSFVQRARSFEKRFGTIPTFAAKDASVRAGLRRAERYFRKSYRRALVQWRSGVRAVAFPVGTWWMRVVHGATIERADIPS